MVLLAGGFRVKGRMNFRTRRLVDREETGSDGQIGENMVLFVESHVGAEGGAGGVRPEEQVLPSAGGTRILGTFPFEEDLLGWDVAGGLDAGQCRGCRVAPRFAGSR